MSSEVDSDLKVVQGMAEQVKDVKVAIPKSCPALYIDECITPCHFCCTPQTQASKLHCQKRELEEAVKALLANLNKQVVLSTNHLNLNQRSNHQSKPT